MTALLSVRHWSTSYQSSSACSGIASASTLAEHRAGHLARRRGAPPSEHQSSPTDAEEASGLRAVVWVWCLLILAKCSDPGHTCILSWAHCYPHWLFIRYTKMPKCTASLSPNCPSPLGNSILCQRLLLGILKIVSTFIWCICAHSTNAVGGRARISRCCSYFTPPCPGRSYLYHPASSVAEDSKMEANLSWGPSHQADLEPQWGLLRELFWNGLNNRCS